MSQPTDLRPFSLTPAGAAALTALFPQFFPQHPTLNVPMSPNVVNPVSLQLHLIHQLNELRWKQTAAFYSGVHGAIPPVSQLICHPALNSTSLIAAATSPGGVSPKENKFELMSTIPVSGPPLTDGIGKPTPGFLCNDLSLLIGNSQLPNSATTTSVESSVFTSSADFRSVESLIVRAPLAESQRENRQLPTSVTASSALFPPVWPVDQDDAPFGARRRRSAPQAGSPPDGTAARACPLCPKRFTRHWLLQGHIRTHTGERPFKCNHCSKAFADKSNLRAHVQTHSNVKNHVCRRCGKRFALKSYLSKHAESSCHTRNSADPRLMSLGRPPFCLR